ncbi:MAG: hypothetical protein COU65_00890 [Candidatus Pacebacteria bacterium CG10_big_fil_rev_8_21_14_0_10_42_12]|nr:hypothetical protein [Candidatus Paceibacterota bacterium]PIR62916.1 MAG: hypothetical protein COU65_00890 [Candidatus Pacebacteria bacterium CG10_big_fil_rev_8_21_14_0_10_42_12]
MSGIVVYSRNKKYDWIFVLAIVVLVAVAEFSGWFGVIKSSSEKFINPILSKSSSGTQNLLDPIFRFSRYPSLAARLSSLEYDYAQSLSRISQLERELRETESIRAALSESAQTKSAPFLTTTLISYTQPGIAAGSDQGVKEGMLVLVAGTAVGTISHVEATQSTTSLFSQTGRHPIIVTSESGVQGVLEGDGRHIYLTLVPQGSVLNSGERVVTVGQENIGAGVFIGKISVVEENSAAPTKRAQIDQLVSFFSAPVVELR